MRIVALAISLVSAALFAYSQNRSALAKRARSWPKTKGRVIASLVEISRDADGPTESAVFAYEYKIGGVAYVSSDVYPGWASSWSTNIPGISSARQLVRRFPLDAVIDVYYSPDKPDMSCIMPGRQTGPRVTMVLSGIVFVISLAYLKAA